MASDREGEDATMDVRAARFRCSKFDLPTPSHLASLSRKIPGFEGCEVLASCAHRTIGKLRRKVIWVSKSETVVKTPCFVDTLRNLTYAPQ